MKTISVFMLVICTQCMVFGQNKDNIYADVACSNLGSSVTYDRKLVKHFDIGLGTSLYNFNGDLYHNIRFATYLDFRPYWVIKRNLLFIIGDAGILFYGGRIIQPAIGSELPTSPYASIGFGYGRRINKWGMGPYVSLCSDWSVVHDVLNNPLLTPDARDYSVVDMVLVISIGFKF